MQLMRGAEREEGATHNFSAYPLAQYFPNLGA